MIVVRFADDLVLGFQYESDATRFHVDLRERFVRFGLELHPDKTRRLRFGRFAEARRRERGERRPEVFEFLGFTHISGTSRTGKRRHLPLPVQGKWIGAVVRGYFAYHAIPTNGRSMCSFRVEVTRHWLHALRRRSQRSRLTWQRMQRLANRWIPSARVLHPYPWERFEARTRGKSRVR